MLASLGVFCASLCFISRLPLDSALKEEITKAIHNRTPEVKFRIWTLPLMVETQLRKLKKKKGSLNITLTPTRIFILFTCEKYNGDLQEICVFKLSYAREIKS